MKSQTFKIITRTGMWIAAITGSTFGLLFTIIGYLMDWGPGGSMHGPFWKILTVGIPSILIAAYIGELIVRSLANKLLKEHLSVLENTVRSFASVLIASLTAFVAGWEVGFIMGKISGAIEGLDWIPVLFYSPLMSLIYGIPVSLAVAVLFGVFVFLYLKREQ